MTVDEYKATVEDVLGNCTFRDCDSLEYRRSILQRLDFGELPIRLFQYRSVSDEMIEGLKWGILRFKSPTRFNDPYDSLMRWDSAEISNLLNNPKYAHILAKHNIFDEDTLAASIKGRFRISCFSEVSDSPVMWAHYAKNGGGFCVEYELGACIGCPLCLKNGQPCSEGRDPTCDPRTCGYFSKATLAPVIYDSRHQDTTLAMKQQILFACAKELGEQCCLGEYDWLEPYKTTLIKSEDWAYEKEWRYILSDLQLRGDQDWQYPYDRIVRVILGAKMNPLEEYKVTKAVEEYARNVKRNVVLAKAYVDVQSSDYRLSIKHERTISGS